MLYLQKPHTDKISETGDSGRRRALGLIAAAAGSTLTSCAGAPAQQARTATRSAPTLPRPAPFRPKGLAPSIVGKAAVVLDANTGSVLHSKSIDSQRAVASTQKLLTALTVIERGGLNSTITVASSDTWVEPSKIYIKAGQRYRKFDLLAALLVRSGNDVARCLARTHSGSVESFAKAMTAKARSLGMPNSNFKNPHGLTTSGQYSTARDMGKLALAAYRSRSVRSITSLKKLPFKYSDGRSVTFSNTNKLLSRSPYCNGLKTGYTRASGRCLISSGQKGNREVVVVILGSTSSSIWNDSRGLLHWGLGA